MALNKMYLLHRDGIHDQNLSYINSVARPGRYNVIQLKRLVTLLTNASSFTVILLP